MAENENSTQQNNLDSYVEGLVQQRRKCVQWGLEQRQYRYHLNRDKSLNTKHEALDRTSRVKFILSKDVYELLKLFMDY